MPINHSARLLSGKTLTRFYCVVVCVLSLATAACSNETNSDESTTSTSHTDSAVVQKPAGGTHFDFVTVGDPGNAPALIDPFHPGLATSPKPSIGSPGDTVPVGDVAYSYSITAYEITNGSYVDFLNVVDAAGTNTYGLYNPNMATDNSGGILQDLSQPAGQRYEVKQHFANKPVGYVSVYSAMRFANSVNNGNTALTESGDYKFSTNINSGAYTLEGPGEVPVDRFPERNPDALFAVPSENEWIKAAYYAPSRTQTAKNPSEYWFYATQTDSAPAIATADSTGMVNNAAAGLVTANYGGGANWNNTTKGNVTTVGSCSSQSHYGTFDQGGNVVEWTDTRVLADSVYNVHGGTFEQAVYSLWISATGKEGPMVVTNRKGFRIVCLQD
jgi:sulfatase modifying factor 1